jgi:possible T4-like proximal tail fiber
MNRVLFTAFMLSAVAAHAQVKKGMVGINTNEPRATLHIEPGTSESKGLIIPRITAAEMVNMSNLPHFGADQHAIITYLKIPMPSIDRTGKLVDVDEPGYYYYDNTTGVEKWRKLGGGGAQDLRMIGNDNHITQDAGVGENGTSVGTGTSNIAIGKAALKSNTTGYNNVVIGTSSLYNNTSGSENIAIGSSILQNNSTGSYNFGIGQNALNQNSTGSYNFALGQGTLLENSTGDYNTGIGYSAGQWIKGNGNMHIGIDSDQSKYMPTVSGQLNKVIFIGHLDSLNDIFDTSNANSNVILLGEDSYNAPKVGIGTYRPAAKLDIKGPYGGAIRIADGSQGQGKVLTSDYNGVGTWKEINVSLFKKAPIAGIFSWAAATELGNTSFNKIASLTVPPGASMIYVKIHLRGANVNAGYTRAYVGTKDIGTNNSNTGETPIGGSTLFVPYTGKDFEMQTSFIYNNTTSGNQTIYLNLQSDAATIKRSAFEYPNGGKAWGTNWVENYFYAVPAN